MRGIQYEDKEGNKQWNRKSHNVGRLILLEVRYGGFNAYLTIHITYHRSRSLGINISKKRYLLFRGISSKLY